jgi:hypothetical protein
MTREPLRDEALLWTIAEAQARCSIGRSSVYALLDAGAWQSVHVGRRRLVLAASVRAWLDRQLAVAPPDSSPPTATSMATPQTSLARPRSAR